MKMKCLLLLLGVLACQSPSSSENASSTYADVQIAGAMKNVMWKGELDPVITLDTLSRKENLFAVGPETGLRGEIMVHEGRAFVSRIGPDSALLVEENFAVGAPFLVYAYVEAWEEVMLPDSVLNLPTLEAFIEKETQAKKRPFAFKLAGKATAIYHAQNLPPGTKVSSPAEAHQGQVNFPLYEEAIKVTGFFSTEHQGVFTHHDSYLHLHLLTEDESRMGHVDAMQWAQGEMQLFLPLR
ncbi:MAG: acetolactate decarboxylase [Bacteroidota bacterium]